MKNSVSSVCVATYNGAKYVRRQMDSILCQMHNWDECVISDDVSMDETLEVILQIEDGRIFLNLNDLNLGHVKNFERVISLAKGDLIFLSDQDDVWMPDKISTINKIFEYNPDVVMIHHNLTTVDEFGNVLERGVIKIESGVQANLTFLIHELFKPRLFGCAMAFRRSVLDVLLPFPKFVYAHDHWITVAALLVGKIYFFDENLVMYRQHEENLTPKSRRSIWEVTRSRVIFLRMIVYAFVRHHLSGIFR